MTTRRRLTDAPDPSKAILAVRSDALALLADGEMTRHELTRVLSRRGHALDVIAAVLDHLEQAGLLDDRRVATLIVRRLAEDKHLGRLRVEAELFRRGVPRDVAREILDETYATRDARADALMLAQARLRRLPVRLSTDVRRRRLASFLARQGFEDDIVHTVIETLLGEPFQE